MIVPLWIPWTVTVALLLTAFAAFLGDSSLPHSRPPRWVKRMLWVPGIVALVATGIVTIDRVHVSQKELDAAAEQAETELEDGPAPVSGDRFALEVQRILGHAASMKSATLPSSSDSSTDSQERTQAYELHPVSERDLDDAKGPVVCVKIEDLTSGSTIEVDEGTCASS